MFLVPPIARFSCFISTSTVGGVIVLTNPNQWSAANTMSVSFAAGAGSGAPYP